MNAMTPLNANTLKKMSTKTLYQELADFLDVTTKALYRAAYVWRELERRGEDLSDLKKKGLCAFLPMIADGKLLPEIVIQLNGSKAAVTHTSRLLIEEQRKLLDAGEVEVRRDSGEVARVKIEKLSPREFERAIDPKAGKIIPVAEQVAPRTTLHSSNPRNKYLALSLTASEYDTIAQKARQANVGMASWVVDVLARAKAFK